MFQILGPEKEKNEQSKEEEDQQVERFINAL